jgi:hypothetical protein
MEAANTLAYYDYGRRKFCSTGPRGSMYYDDYYLQISTQLAKGKGSIPVADAINQGILKGEVSLFC